MQKHLAEVISFKQFTIIAPTDASFESMSDADLRELTDDVHARRDFLKKHIFIGDLRTGNGVNKAVGYSVSPNHSVVSVNTDKGKDVVVDDEDQVFQVIKSHPVYEGFVHIVNKME